MMGFDAGLDGFFIEFQRTEHGAVVGHGHRDHPVILGPFHQCIDSDSAVQEAVLGVQVQVHEICLLLCHGGVSRRILFGVNPGGSWRLFGDDHVVDMAFPHAGRADLHEAAFFLSASMLSHPR